MNGGLNPKPGTSFVKSNSPSIKSSRTSESALPTSSLSLESPRRIIPSAAISPLSGSMTASSSTPTAGRRSSLSRVSRPSSQTSAASCFMVKRPSASMMRPRARLISSSPLLWVNVLPSSSTTRLPSCFAETLTSTKSRSSGRTMARAPLRAFPTSAKSNGGLSFFSEGTIRMSAWIPSPEIPRTLPLNNSLKR